MDYDFWPGRKDLQPMTNPGQPWLVTLTKPSRLIDKPTIMVYVDTQLTRVPAKQQAERKALDRLKAMGVRNPEVLDARPAGAEAGD